MTRFGPVACLWMTLKKVDPKYFPGSNNLGLILMDMRSKLQSSQPQSQSQGNHADPRRTVPRRL